MQYFLAHQNESAEVPTEPSLLTLQDQNQSEYTFVNTGLLNVEANVGKSATLSNLTSETNYTLFVTARDLALLPNYFPFVVAHNVSTPDVTPPQFTGMRTRSSNDIIIFHSMHCSCML